MVEFMSCRSVCDSTINPAHCPLPPCILIKASSGFMPPPFFPPGFPVPGRGQHPMVPTNPDDAWNEYTAPDGRKYYCNSITQENTWDKPQVLIDKEGMSPMKSVD